MATGERISCQVCGRRLVPLADGTSRNHYPRPGRQFEDYCQGSRYRLARWPVGQHLRHHGGSVWIVEADLGGSHGDYRLRCVIGSRAFDGDRWLEPPGKTMGVHGEYVHRHGWTPVELPANGEEQRDAA